MVTFRECTKSGYAARTEQNAANADVTIAIAKTFGTAGEQCTKKYVKKYEKLYVPVRFSDVIEDERIAKIVEFIGDKEVAINIAGNGLYHFDYHTQETLNNWMVVFLSNLRNKGLKIKSIRSGGQTGIDTAGSVAANILHIPSIVLAPKNWMFRIEKYQDIRNEEQFKARFI